MAPASFAFVPRSRCICGAQLSGTSAEVARRLPSGEVSFRSCTACGSWVQSPMLTAASHSAWLDSSDYQGAERKRGVGYADYARDERQRALEAALRYRRDIAPYLRPRSRVLEVGCASGTLLAEIARHGHEVIGCDLSARFAQAARRLYGLDVTVADWLDLALPPASLDAVLLLGTVSNLRCLGECLERARGQLRPGGMLFFNFPAADSLPARLYGKRMWMFTPSVMQFMTRRGVAAALDRAGLAIAACRTDRQAPSLGKLIGHARLVGLYPLFDRLGLLDVRVPVALPIPGVLAVRAVCLE
jgi:SAM-dependent methyltransferase